MSDSGRKRHRHHEQLFTRQNRQEHSEGVGGMSNHFLLMHAGLGVASY